MPCTRSGDRTRPTTSVGKHERRVVVDEKQEIYAGSKDVAADDVALKDVVFGGGPMDKSVLTEYTNHVACKLWDDLVYQ